MSGSRFNAETYIPEPIQYYLNADHDKNAVNVRDPKIFISTYYFWFLYVRYSYFSELFARQYNTSVFDLIRILISIWGGYILTISIGYRSYSNSYLALRIWGGYILTILIGYRSYSNSYFALRRVYCNSINRLSILFEFLFGFEEGILCNFYNSTILRTLIFTMSELATLWHCFLSYYDQTGKKCIYLEW